MTPPAPTPVTDVCPFVDGVGGGPAEDDREYAAAGQGAANLVGYAGVIRVQPDGAVDVFEASCRRPPPPPSPGAAPALCVGFLCARALAAASPPFARGWFAGGAGAFGQKEEDVARGRGGGAAGALADDGTGALWPHAADARGHVRRHCRAPRARAADPGRVGRCADVHLVGAARDELGAGAAAVDAAGADARDGRVPAPQERPSTLCAQTRKRARNCA